MTNDNAECQFALDPQMEQDTRFITRLALSRVLLMNDARYPWVILVPERTCAVEIIDLGETDRAMLLAEICQVSEALRQLHRPHKLNVAALGNQVRQLHIHVIARQTDDAAWPGPVWGVGTATPYEEYEAAERIGAIRAALSQ